MLVVTKDFTQDAGTTMTASTEATSMPASNLKELQPSERTRITTITDTPHVQGALDGGGAVSTGYDVLFVAAYDGAPSRNMLRSALNLTATEWTYVNVTNTPGIVSPPSALSLAPLDIAATATGVVTIDQTFTVPGKSSPGDGPSNLALRLEIWARQNDVVDDLDLKLFVGSAIATHDAFAVYNLGSGSVGSSGDTGNYTLDSAAIAGDDDGDWYRCTLNFTTDVADSMTIRLQLLTGAGATSIPITESLLVGAPVMLLQSADSTVAEYPVTSHIGTGPMFRVRYGWDLTTSEHADSPTDWEHCASRNFLKGYEDGRYNFYHKITSQLSEYDARVEFWDPHNALGYIEMGRFGIGQSSNLSPRMTDIELMFEETGGQQEADGGQIYRSQRTVRRGMGMTFRAFTRAEAMDDIAFLMSSRGRSRQVFAVGSPNAWNFKQNTCVYGYLNQLDPIPSPTKTIWNWRTTVIETP